MKIRGLKSKCKRHPEGGVALIMALLCVIVLSLLAGALVFVTKTEMVSSGNYRQLAQSRYVAEAGAQATVDWLANNLPAPDPSLYTTTSYPIALSGQSCNGTSQAGCVLLDTTSSRSTFPDSGNTLRSGFANYFNSSSNGTQITGLSGATASNAVTAQLMSIRPVTAFGSSSTQYLQSWKIKSTGSLTTSQTAQTEVRLEVETFLTPFPQYAAFGNSSNCNAIGLVGNAKTDSYDSSLGNYTVAGSVTNSGGNVGTNGSASLTSNAAVNGTDSWANKAGNCSPPSGGNPGTIQKISPVTLPPLPAVPAGIAVNSTAFTGTMSPNVGYSGVSLSGSTTLTLGPGTYYMDSLSVSGQGQILVSPAGSKVIIYITGTGSTGGFSIAGNGISNIGTGDVPANFQILYGGSAPSSIVGNGSTQAVVYAPNSNISINGNGSLGGSIVGNTVSFNGNGVVHYDRNLNNNFGFLTNFITTAFSWDNAD